MSHADHKRCLCAILAHETAQFETVHEEELRRMLLERGLHEVLVASAFPRRHGME